MATTSNVGHATAWARSSASRHEQKSWHIMNEHRILANIKLIEHLGLYQEIKRLETMKIYPHLLNIILFRPSC
jgi:hypothetical protein